MNRIAALLRPKYMACPPVLTSFSRITSWVRLCRRRAVPIGLAALFIGAPLGYLIAVILRTDMTDTRRIGCLIGLFVFLIGTIGVIARRLTDQAGLRDPQQLALFALVGPALFVAFILDRRIALAPMCYLGFLAGYELTWSRRSAGPSVVDAIAAERARIGRDLHDLIGHALSTITLKAQLAGRLIAREPDRAGAEIDAVAGLSRRLLAESRQAVRGYRTGTLVGEFAGARAALAAAGVTFAAPAHCPPLPAPVQSTMSWVLRECVTNVVRHSRAASCAVTVSADRGVARMRVHDDGVGLGNRLGAGVGVGVGVGVGSGIAGMVERVRQAGGRLELAPAVGGGLVVEVAVPI